MRNSWAIAGAAAVVAAVLLVGAWFLLGGQGTGQAGTNPPEVASTTVLSRPPDPSDGSKPPDPYPTVPLAQLQGDHAPAGMVRTDADGRRLLVQLTELDCWSEEVRLLDEHRDRVEVEIRMVAKPPPPSAGSSPDGSYGCVSYSRSDAPHAVIELREPLGNRAVVLHFAS